MEPRYITQYLIISITPIRMYLAYSDGSHRIAYNHGTSIQPIWIDAHVIGIL